MAHEFTVMKLDHEQRLVFGWANISVTTDGEVVEQWGADGFNDVMPPDVIEKAAYEFVLDSREGGVMHKVPEQAVLVESFVVTPEKLSALKLAADALPLGWWCGFKILSDATWERVKKGELRMFSVHGTARREGVS